MTQRIPLDPQPEHRVNHLGGAWFCHGDHPQADPCSAHAEEIPCPHGIVGSGVTVEQDADGTWVWVVAPACANCGGERGTACHPACPEPRAA